MEIRTTLKIKDKKMQIQKNFKDSEKSNFINIEKIGQNQEKMGKKNP